MGDRQKAATERPSSRGGADSSRSPKPGDPVEVFSNSLKAWCPGEIQSVGEGESMVKVSYSDGSMMYSKTIEWGHPNIRRRTFRDGEEHQQSKGEARRQKELQRREDNRYRVGDKIQIWSNSNKQWCLGEVLT